MKNIKRTIILFILGFGMNLISQGSYAQNSLSLPLTHSIVIDFSAPIEPGSPIQPVIDNSRWLNYTVTTTSPDPYSITAEITSGSIAEGLQLQLQAGAYNGTRECNPGMPTGSIILTNIPQVIINGIGTCDNEIGLNVGHPLTYTLSICNYSLVNSSSSAVNILFTIIQ